MNTSSSAFSGNPMGINRDLVGLRCANPTFYDLSEAVKVFCVSSWDSDQQLVRIASKLSVSCTWTERLTTFYPLVFDQPNPACALRSR